MFRTTHYKLGVRTNREKGMKMIFSVNMTVKKRKRMTVWYIVLNLVCRFEQNKQKQDVCCYLDFLELIG